jgi:small-conductance mechanosensitive channel
MKKIVLIITCLLSLFAGQLSHADQVSGPSKPLPKAAVNAQSAPQPVEEPAGYPVVLSGVEIFRVISSPIDSLSPQSRASVIQQNIQKFAEGELDTQALKVSKLKEGAAITEGENTLMIITQQDASYLGESPEDIAKEMVVRIQSSVIQYRTRHSWQVYGLGATYSLLAIIGLWLALFWNNRAFIWLKFKASTKRSLWMKGLQLQGVEVLSSRKIDKFILVLIKVLRLLVVLLCLYFFLPLILSFFPETSELSSQILEYLVSPFVSIFHTVVGYLPNLFYILVIIVIANYVLELISYVFNLIETGELVFEWFYDDWARPTYQIIRFLVIVTALISAYPYIPGSSSEAFQGVGLVLGALISFASSSAISNIVAGIILTYTRGFKLNDRIKVGDTTGDVVDKTLLVTRLMTIKRVIVTIPNSVVMGSQIINYSTSAAEGEGVILHTSVTIGYDVPWKKVQSLLVEAALDTQSVEAEPAPFVLQTSLDDFYVSYELNVYTKVPHRMALTYSELHKNILEKFDAASVEILSPHYYAVRDGNASTVPSVLNSADYNPPVFNIARGHAEVNAKSGS